MQQTACTPATHCNRSQQKPSPRQRQQGLHLTTKILRSPSKLINAKPVKLAPTSPYNFVVEAQTASINSRSLGKPSHSSCSAKYRRLTRFNRHLPSLTTLMPGATNLGTQLFTVTIEQCRLALVETASNASISPKPKKIP